MSALLGCKNFLTDSDSHFPYGLHNFFLNTSVDGLMTKENPGHQLVQILRSRRLTSTDATLPEETGVNGPVSYILRRPWSTVGTTPLPFFLGLLYLTSSKFRTGSPGRCVPETNPPIDLLVLGS